MTVSAFAPLCLDPPCALVCVNRHTATAVDILERGVLGINVLGEHQLELSRRCAAPGEAKFLDDDDLLPDIEGGSYLAPVLRTSVISLDCRADVLDAPVSHLAVLAHVVAVVPRADRPPLLYGDGQYHRALPLHPSASQGASR